MAERIYNGEAVAGKLTPRQSAMLDDVLGPVKAFAVMLRKTENDGSGDVLEVLLEHCENELRDFLAAECQG